MKVGAVDIGPTEEPSAAAAMSTHRARTVLALSSTGCAKASRRGHPHRPGTASPARRARRSPASARRSGGSSPTRSRPAMGTLVIGLVLAGIMSPRDFGVFAVAIVALLACAAWMSGRAPGHRRVARRPGEIAPTAMMLSLACGARHIRGCYMAAPALRREHGGPPAAVGVIRILGLSVLFGALAATPLR